MKDKHKIINKKKSTKKNDKIYFVKKNEIVIGIEMTSVYRNNKLNIFCLSQE
jgi:hypothetical protein